MKIKQSFSWHPRASAALCELKDAQSLHMRGKMTVLANFAFFYEVKHLISYSNSDCNSILCSVFTESLNPGKGFSNAFAQCSK